MKDVKALLTRRDNLFIDQTNNVISHLEPITAGIKQFLVGVDPSYDGGDFVWEDIGMYDEDLLMLIGKVVYPVGHEYEVDDKWMVIDAENQNYFSRTLRIGLPITIVNLGEPEPVVDFLSKLRSSNSVTLQSDPNAAEAEAEIAEKEKKIKTVTAKTKNKKDATDFDLDELTDEQRASLELFKRTV